MGKKTLASHVKATLTLGLPLIGAHLAQVAVGITDTVMLGRYQVEALAAGVLGSSMFFTLFIAASGFARAVVPQVSSASAKGDETAVRRATRMGLWMSLLFGVLLYPLCWFSEPILRVLGQEPEVAANAQIYLRIAGLGLIPSLLVASLVSTLSGLEHTRVVLWATLGGALVNCGLNWVLIFGNLGAPELGLAGAAIASISVHVVMLVALVIYAASVQDLKRFDFFTRLYKPDWPAFAALFFLGWPISLTLLAEVGLFSASALMMGALGTIPLAAHGIALQIASLTFMVHLGLSAAATVRVGGALGREDWQEVGLASKASFLLSFVFVAVTIVVFLTLPGPLISLFLNEGETLKDEIVALGIVLLAFAGLFQLVDAMQVMALGCLRGLHDTRKPMIYAWIGYWGIGLPVAYGMAFPLGFGPSGVWLGLSVGLAVAAFLLTRRLIVLIREEKNGGVRTTPPVDSV